MTLTEEVNNRVWSLKWSNVSDWENNRVGIAWLEEKGRKRELIEITESTSDLEDEMAKDTNRCWPTKKCNDRKHCQVFCIGSRGDSAAEGSSACDFVCLWLLKGLLILATEERACRRTCLWFRLTVMPIVTAIVRILPLQFGALPCTCGNSKCLFEGVAGTKVERNGPLMELE